jgi:hypothetical protein
VPNSFTYANSLAPSAVTAPAIGVLATSATLWGPVGEGNQAAQGGGNSTYAFQWGTDPTFGTYSTPTATNFSGTGQSVSASLTGLTTSTRYAYRAIATNLAGTTTGQAFSFETALSLPTLLTPAATISGGPPSGPITFSWQYNSGGASGGQTGYSLQVTGVVPGESGSGWAFAEYWARHAAAKLRITP